VHLKEQEIKRIEEVTLEWRKKESEREEKFTEACKKVQTLENKIRQKSTDLDRREEKLVHLEDELRQKIIEVSR
jgi:centrosomal protein CEP120